MSDSSATHSLRLTSTAARAVLVFFLLTHALLLVWNLSGVTSVAPSIVAYVLIAAASILLVTVGEPFPRRAAAAVALSAPAAAALVSWQLPATGPTGYASWHLGALSLVLFLLALRDRVRMAWLAMAAACAITIGWAVSVGRGLGFGFEFTIRHAGILLIGTVFAAGLRRTASRVRTVAVEQQVRAGREADARSVLAERARRMRELSDRAKPTLVTLSSATSIPPELAREARLLEAQLRDALRAPGFSREPLISAAREARERGVEIVLMDDSDGAFSEEQYERAVHDVERAVRRLPSGRLTARLLPPDRTAVATIVADDGTTIERLWVTMDDAPASAPTPSLREEPTRG